MTKINWTPLHLHTHFSLLDGISKPENVAKKCGELGYSACAITDHGSVSGAVDFIQACNKQNIKPILGSELYVSNKDSNIKDSTNALKHCSHLVVLSKNLKGWKNLIKITSKANDTDNYYYRPRLDIEKIREYSGDLIAFSGHPGSMLAKCMFDENGNLISNPTEEVVKHALYYQEIFGKGNFFIEIQQIYHETFPIAKTIVEILREASELTNIPCVATADSHYINSSDAIDQRVILCSMLKTTLNKVNNAIANSEEFGLSGFFKSDKFHIPTLQEMQSVHTEEEINNAYLIENMCEKYNILKNPQLPKFDCPNGLTENEYLKELCRRGWKEKIANKGLNENVYKDRVLMELGVIEQANLSGYFLIVQDYVNWAKNQGWLVGPGRGSVGGSLVAYLINITTIDPIKYNLIFERFYNSGRNTKDNVSLPDIDVDFPITKKDLVVDYIRNKYGHDKVTQISTFGALQGRSALKEVLRVHDACSFYEMNEISKCLPQKHMISDQLEESQETSIIRWTLENEPDLVKDYCRLDDNGNYTGDYAQYFEQAARLEGIYKSQGKHPAGVVITPEPVSEICPIVIDKKTSRPIAGIEMEGLANIGGGKMDVLGCAVFDKLMCVNELLATGKCSSMNDLVNESEELDD